jgi:Ca2+-transporting ATPase
MDILSGFVAFLRGERAMTQASPKLPVLPIWHNLSVEEALGTTRSSETGLSQAEATRRLASHGPNILARQSSDGTLTLLWRQINSPLVWVLTGSAILAMGLGKLTDGGVVIAVVAINTIIGFVQEFRAGKAIEALVDMVPENATVVRDGKRDNLAVAELVPGDIILLASGDKVPADVRLLLARNLQIEEAALTGESVPTEKSSGSVAASAGLGDRLCMAYGGTLVTYGTATALVVATGSRTELGRISTLLKEATALQTPLTKALGSIGKVITGAVLAISFVMVLVGMLRMMAAGVGFGLALKDTLIFAVALAVGAIPEGLPAIVTIALAIGVQRMASRRAIVRKLPAVETLGSTTTICTDKTGTLTRNEMTVRALWTPLGAYEVTGVGYEPQGELRQDGKAVAPIPEAVNRLLLDGLLCNDAAVFLADGAWRLSGDPTEGALVTSALKFRADAELLRKTNARLDAIPFESENQFMATLHALPTGTWRLIMKGAPEVLLRRCGGAQGGTFDPAAVLRAVDEMAAQGMRVLAIAARNLSAPIEHLEMQHVAEGMEFIGLQGMIDPPRTEAIEAVKVCHAAGITVKMITGDHKGTAAAIGRQLGLLTEGGAITGVELQASSDENLRLLVRTSNVFARVAPEHKLRLVKALQANDEVVAMTGDGVNDAPALKQSNIGVAMGITGTGVSKEAADIVLTDDNFASIAAAVEEGRRVYDNLIKSLAFVLPTNLGLALILIYAVAFFPFDPVSKELLLPMLPVQLLWINLVATVSLALPLAFEAKEPDIMRRHPRPPKEPVLSKFVIYRTLVTAVLMATGAIALFHHVYSNDLAAGVPAALALRQAQTITVSTVILFQIFYMINCRSLKGSILKIGMFSNPAIFVGVGVLLLLQVAFIYFPFLQGVFGSSPIEPYDLWLATLVGASVLPLISLEKWWRARATRKA